MFLAFNEIRHEVRHYTLITAMITLVGLLVFFLTGLAVGLNSAMTSSIRSWPASTVYLSSTSNESVLASFVPEESASALQGTDTALFGLTSVTVEQSDGSQVNAFAMGLDADSFIAPKLTEGDVWAQPGDAVVDESMRDEGYAIGDTFTLAQSDQELTITGFTDNATYSSYPVMYISIADWQALGVQYDGMVSGVATDGDVDTASVSGDLTALSTTDFINAIPGVSAQNITFGLMIAALIIISAVVLGVFTYVLTLQKQKVFGVMKAQGISNGMIGWSVLWQTAFLSIFGSVFAVAVSTALGVILPDGVPFTIPVFFWIVIGAIIVVFSLIGALFSVRSATKIDPLEALR
ncbi:ABC transporter permease [Changpingibacter yushuensis]|uniref:ABC transporter permease n=1 Tax=Changpingibacter yushuensis TaxID=2758440 RepID=UPI00165DB9EE|nr:ABC transporter permease [Changpingibacter yushuensis]